MTPSATRRLLGLFLVSGIVQAACTQGDTPAPGESAANPWTHLSFLDRSEAFQFAVVADRAGGHRLRASSRGPSTVSRL